MCESSRLACLMGVCPLIGWQAGRTYCIFSVSYFVGHPSLETMFRTYTIQFNTSICRFWVIQMAEIIHTFYFSKNKSVFQSMSYPTRNQGLRFCRTYIFPIRRKWCMFGYASFQRFRCCRTYTRLPAHLFTDNKKKEYAGNIKAPWGAAWE